MMQDDEHTETMRSAAHWQLLLRLRWPLGAAITFAFAVGQVLEALILDGPATRPHLLFDVVAWGLLGGLAVWASLTWAIRQEHRYDLGLEQSLLKQQNLNRQLQRANRHLALLSEVNRHIADSIKLDDILDAALVFPQQLVPAHAAALLLNDTDTAIETRITGANADELAHLRTRLGIARSLREQHHPHLIAAGTSGAALILPLHNGQTLIGWIELYLHQTITIPDDEQALLETIASEIAEAIVSTRRRSREERAIYELERAIADERARIARDIHDGIAQTLAFRRMRIDLWLDWLTSEPQRLRDELIGLKQTLREQIAELRRAIFALRPIQFDEFGFVGGLHRYIGQFAEQHGWESHIDLSGAPSELSPDREAICFRIIQESLTNSAKHANATRIDVRIAPLDGGLHIVVSDNGIGFDPGMVAEQPHEHLGLRQMRERLRHMQGQLTICSQPGAGTHIRAWIPGNHHSHPQEHLQEHAHLISDTIKE